LPGLRAMCDSVGGNFRRRGKERTARKSVFSLKGANGACELSRGAMGSALDEVMFPRAYLARKRQQRRFLCNNGSLAAGDLPR
jgi:hypothetical protein